jgi:hypothetical protein
MQKPPLVLSRPRWRPLLTLLSAGLLLVAGGGLLLGGYWLIPQLLIGLGLAALASFALTFGVRVTVSEREIAQTGLLARWAVPWEASGAWSVHRDADGDHSIYFRTAAGRIYLVSPEIVYGPRIAEVAAWFAAHCGEPREGAAEVAPRWWHRWLPPSQPRW